VNSKIIYIVLGVALVMWGASIIIDPVQYSSKYSYTWDFTDIRWFFGGFIVVLGAYLIVLSLSKK